MRLMIVDDDDQIRVGMANAIQWNTLGIDEVESCRNGVEALKRMQEIRFDILITDISMPEMTGVDLLRCAKEFFEDIHVILISGYKEFEYAEAGIRYGADDYILKPIHLNELMDTVTKVMHKIERRKEEQKNQTMAKEFVRNQLMSKIIQGKSDSHELKKYLLTDCGFERIHTLLGVAVSDDDGLYCLEEEKTKGIFLKKIAEYLVGYKYTLFPVDGSEIFLLVDVADSTFLVYQLKQQIKRAVESINKEIDRSISVGISEQGSLEKITQSYKNAKYALDFRFYYGRGVCLFYQDCLETESKKDIKENIFRKEKLINILEKGSEEEVLNLVEMGRRELFGCKIERLQKIMFESMIDISKVYAGEMSEQIIRHAVFDAKSFSDMMELLKNFMLSALKKTMDEGKYSKDICSALEYIRVHYQEKITLEEVADLLDISTGHLSRIFKQQVGISFVKYLNQYRINRAEQLLKSTNLKIYEIAEQVGISDYIYFTQVFRNIKGKSPKDIRNSS